MRSILFLLALLFLFACTTKEKPTTAPASAGFRIITTRDTTRLFKPGVADTNDLFYRPLDIDVWYPAELTAQDSALPLRSMIGLLEQRANYYTSSTVGNGITQQIAESFCEHLNCSDTGKLLNFRTQSFLNAHPSEGNYPLILYLTSYNGMSFENTRFFEALARKGFVVASISSIGRYPGDMTMKNEDIQEQVKDALAVLKTLQGEPGIDVSRIGIVGYSWGGLAGAILAGKLPQAACLVSLDGSEFHHYGESKGENQDFDGIRYNSDFKSMKLSMPYLRLESAPPPNNAEKYKEDSVYDFTEKLLPGWQIYLIDSAQHEDFGSMPDLVRLSGHCPPTRYHQLIAGLSLEFLEDQLKKGSGFKALVDESIKKKTIKRK